jgi:hypothetical protein
MLSTTLAQVVTVPVFIPSFLIRISTWTLAALKKAFVSFLSTFAKTPRKKRGLEHNQRRDEKTRKKT